MKIQSILALTDLSLQGRLAVDRAALIAAHHRALLKIMVTPADFSVAARPPADSALVRLAAEVHQRFGVLVKTVREAGAGLSAITDEARAVDLLIVGAHRDTSAAALFSGQPAERLLRTVRCPVLVVRRTVLHRYRRILVAVDFTPESKRLVGAATALDRDAEVELFHALTTTHEGKLRYADVSARATKAYLHECARDAHERLFWLTDSSTARRNRVRSALGRGDVAKQAVIQQQHAEAELLVLGKYRVSALCDFIFGSVAQRALRWSGGDLLLMSHDPGAEAQKAPAALNEVQRGHHADLMG